MGKAGKERLQLTFEQRCHTIKPNGETWQDKNNARGVVSLINCFDKAKTLN